MMVGERNGPEWLLEPQTVVLSGTTVYVFDWTPLGNVCSQILFYVANTGAGAVTVTPETSDDQLHVVVGPMAPEAFTVAAGEAGHNIYSGYYGTGEMRSWWRLSLSGTTTVIWGVKGLKR